MQPSLIYELLEADSALAGLGVSRIIESQSIDTRPDAAYFVTIHMEEPATGPVQILGPRAMTIAVHHPWDIDRDYDPITKILNRIDQLLLPVDQQTGQDGTRVSQVRRGSPPRSGNMTDEAWKTVTRWGNYRVSYDEFGA